MQEVPVKGIPTAACSLIAYHAQSIRHPLVSFVGLTPQTWLVSQTAIPPRWGHSSVGRALEWHSRGQGFDSPWLHHFIHKISMLRGLLFESERPLTLAGPPRYQMEAIRGQKLALPFVHSRGQRG
jgi:hypothetical protein